MNPLSNVREYLRPRRGLRIGLLVGLGVVLLAVGLRWPFLFTYEWWISLVDGASR